MRSRRAALLAAAVALAGCPRRAPPPDLSLDPVELAAQVRAAQDRTRSVRGEVRIRLETAELSGTFTALAAAEVPDRLLVQTLDFFGNTVAVLAAADGELSFYDARAHVVYRGPATAENLARLVPLAVSPADLVRILCGSAPLLDGRPVSAEAGRGYVTLAVDAGERTETLRVFAGAEVRRASVRASGAAGRGAYDLELDAFDRFEFRFPAELTFSSDAPRVRMRLGWVDVEPNRALDRRLFTPRVPPGARVVELGAAAPPAGLFPQGGGPRPQE